MKIWELQGKVTVGELEQEAFRSSSQTEPPQGTSLAWSAGGQTVRWLHRQPGVSVAGGLRRPLETWQSFKKEKTGFGKIKGVGWAMLPLKALGEGLPCCIWDWLLAILSILGGPRLQMHHSNLRPCLQRPPSSWTSVYAVPPLCASSFLFL